MIKNYVPSYSNHLTFPNMYLRHCLFNDIENKGYNNCDVDFDADESGGFVHARPIRHPCAVSGLGNDPVNAYDHESCHSLYSYSRERSTMSDRCVNVTVH